MRRTNNNNILIIDDDPGVRGALLESLNLSLESSESVTRAAALFGESPSSDQITSSRPNYSITLATNGLEGIEKVDAALRMDKPYALAFVDMNMPGLNGAETVRRIWQLDSRIKIVFITAFSEYSVEDIVKIVGRDELVYLRKPFNIEEIRQLSRALVRQWNTEKERRVLAKSLAKSREQEISIAAKIQNTLLFTSPPVEIDGVKIAQMSIASKQVDGDFYDFFKIGSRCFDLVLGDVMGKGVPAALLGAATKNHFLRTFNHLMLTSGCNYIPDPEDVVTSVQQTMISRLEQLETFVTLCYARFDTETKRIKYVDCGHMRTIHFCSREKRCLLLQGVNMPLGFPETAPFKQTDFTFDSGDLFFFYSDGVTESANGGFELFGEERLLQIIQKNGKTASPEEMVNIVKEEIITFSGRDDFADDVTCIAVKIE